MKSSTICLTILKDVLVYWNTLVIVITPLALLPLLLCIQTSEAACGYCLILMAVYWITEAMPLPITAFLPVFLFPLLGIMTGKQIAAAYLSDTSMVYIGALMLALAVEKSNLHSRVSLKILTLVGSRESMLLLGFMIPTWFLSMWINNTSTTAMMIPVADAVIQQKMAEIDNDQKSKQDKLASHETSNGNISSVTISNHSPALSTRNDYLTEVTYFGDTSEKTLDLSMNVNEINSRSSVATDTTCEVTQSVVTSDTKSVVMSEQMIANDAEYKQLVHKHKNFAKMMTLSIAYASNIGGTATLTGTPTNLLVAQMATSVWESHGMTSPITYLSWMLFGVPHAIICLIFAWTWLNFFYLGWRSFCCCVAQNKDPKESNFQRIIEEKYKDLGPIRFSEVSVTVLFVLLVILWFARDPGFAPGYSSLFKTGYVSDAVPAFIVSTLLFVVPSERPNWLCIRRNKEIKAKTVPSLLDWNTVTQKLPWGAIILLGGGYTLAEGMNKSGLSMVLGDQLKHLNVLPIWSIAFIVITFVAFFTEITSNTVVVSIVLPMLVAMAADLSINPLYLMLPAGIAASYAFMLPVATPPNAIVFSYGRLQVQDMAKAGLMMNLLCILICMLGLSTWGMALFDLDVLPWQDTSNITTAHSAAFSLLTY